MTITAPACTFDGFGKMATACFSDFRRTGEDVRFLPLVKNETLRSKTLLFPQIIKDSFTEKPIGPEVVFAPIDWMHIPSPNSVLVTTVDNANLNLAAVDILKMYKAVIVFNKFSEEAIRFWGVSAISTLLDPLGTQEIWSEDSSLKEDLFTFGVVDWTPFSICKGHIDTVLEAFEWAFSGMRGMRIRILTHPDSHKSKHHDERIEFTHSSTQNWQLMEWFQSLDCFVSTHEFQGIDLTMDCAVKCGAVPMGNQFALRERVWDQIGYPVFAKFTGGKFVLDKHEVADAMRFAYYDKCEFSQRKERCRNAVYPPVNWGKFLKSLGVI